jgi:hypothetical protein
MKFTILIITIQILDLAYQKHMKRNKDQNWGDTCPIDGTITLCKDNTQCKNGWCVKPSMIGVGMECKRDDDCKISERTKCIFVDEIGKKICLKESPTIAYGSSCQYNIQCIQDTNKKVCRSSASGGNKCLKEENSAGDGAPCKEGSECRIGIICNHRNRCD